MPGWPASAAPAVRPRPVTTLSAPSGKPTSRASAATRRIVSEASSAGLTTHGVAGGERRADGASEDLHRVVPGHDMPGHPVRHALDADEMRVEIGDHVAVQLVGGAAVEFEIAGERDGVGAGLAQGLAVVAALQDGELVRLRLDGGRRAS